MIRQFVSNAGFPVFWVLLPMAFPVWGGEGGGEIACLRGFPKKLYALHLSPDGTRLSVSTTEGQVILLESLKVRDKEALRLRAMEAEARLGPLLAKLVQDGCPEKSVTGFIEEQKLDDLEKAVARNYLMKRCAAEILKDP